MKHSLCFLISIFVMTSLLGGCTSLSLQKRIKKNTPVRLGVLGFRITAPIKTFDDIATLDKKDEKMDFKVDSELQKREQEAKIFFISYMKRFRDIDTVDIPYFEIKWSKGFKIPRREVKRIRDKYKLDALIFGEVPWYGKTNIMYPIIGLTSDILAESIIIGLVTQWNWPIIWANVGLELVTNTPLWFGGSWLFGHAYKPVTLETRLYVFNEKIQIFEESFEAARSKHMLEKYPKKDRKKKQFQLEASFRKVLKEVATELNEK